MGIKRIKTRSQRITRIKESLPVLVISKKPHRTAGFHENLEKRSQVGFWAVILLLQFGIWVSGPRQTDKRDLGFRTLIDRLTELTEILKKLPIASLASPFPHPPKPLSQTQRLTELIYMISD
jgi:hypothetical protein